MKRKNFDINVDEADVIKLLRRDNERRLRELASQYIEGPLEGDHEGKVSNTVLSPGLKLRLKSDKGSWEKGMLWVVTDPMAHPGGQRVSITADQVLLTHTDQHGNTEDMVILKDELDDTFELQ